jgi:hypothetical protein
MSKHIGSNFDDFLDQEGVLANAEAIAVKRVIAFQFEALMKEQKLTKTQLSRRMKTSRASLDRCTQEKQTFGGKGPASTLSTSPLTQQQT